MSGNREACHGAAPVPRGPLSSTGLLSVHRTGRDARAPAWPPPCGGARGRRSCMSNSDAPTGLTGGPASPYNLDDLPDKLRVHALAKFLGRTSRDVLAALTELGH